MEDVKVMVYLVFDLCVVIHKINASQRRLTRLMLQEDLIEASC